jgi:hypothetical protein
MPFCHINGQLLLTPESMRNLPDYCLHALSVCVALLDRIASPDCSSPRERGSCRREAILDQELKAFIAFDSVFCCNNFTTCFEVLNLLMW